MKTKKAILTLKTLGDVRKMLLGLPEAFQLKPTWGHVAVMLEEAARGGDIIDVVVPLRMVLGMKASRAGQSHPVPRQILKDIPRPPSKASRDD
jgi:hypothetical protein